MSGPRLRTASSLVGLGAASIIASVTAVPAVAWAQAAITAKPIGSSKARSNRQKIQQTGEQRTVLDSVGAATTPGRTAPAPAPAAAAAAGTCPCPTPAPPPKTRLDSLKRSIDTLRTDSTLRALVGRALEVGFRKRPGDSTAALGWAVERVLRAKLFGHTNDQRFYVGGKVVTPLYTNGGGDAQLLNPVLRAQYFLPISPLRRWQLPLLTNLTDINVAEEASAREARDALTQSSAGAYAVLEPTFDPFVNAHGDVRMQFLLHGGAKLNALRSTVDTTDSTSHDFPQFRLGSGVHTEIGIRETGTPSVVVDVRVLYSHFRARRARELLGGRGSEGRWLAEAFALVPVVGSTALMVESIVAYGVRPVLRVGLFAMAAGARDEKKGTTGDDQ